MDPIDVLPLLTSFMFSFCAGEFLRSSLRERRSMKALSWSDWAFGSALCISSILLLLFVLGSVLTRAKLPQESVLITGLAGALGVLWLSAFLVGLMRPAQREYLRSALQAAGMLLVFWIVGREPVFSWSDVFLLIGLTFFIAVHAARNAEAKPDREKPPGTDNIHELRTRPAPPSQEPRPLRRSKPRA